LRLSSVTVAPPSRTGSDLLSRALSRTLKLHHLVFYGVGTMVGAGIYSVIGAAAGTAGRHLWVSFLLAAVSAFLTVLSYAELVSAFPKAGAEYQFLKAAFPNRRLLSFMAGYLIALNAAATSATVSLAFAGYLDVFAGVSPIATAFALLSLCTAVNVLGIRESTWFSIGLICVEVAGLLLMIAAGFLYGEIGRSYETAPASGDMAGIFAATALIFFIYIGFEDVANLAEETHEPKRTVPRALIVSVLITSVLYICVALAVIGLAEPDELEQSRSPLTTAAGNASPWMGQALAVAALFATASTALIALVSISRLLFGMARDGDMPKLLSRTWKSRKTPWIAAIALFAGATALLPLGRVEIVASVSSFGVLLVFSGVHVALLKLRFSKPALKRTFTVPGAIRGVPLLPVLGLAISLALLTQFELIVYAVGGGAVLLGLAVYSQKRAFTRA
jgi:APA family basic amino acid/polyamine antiporter